MSTSKVLPAVVVDGLRRWARGAYAEEAAVELLVRAFGGRFASAGCQWVQPCERPGWFWLDGESMLHDTAALSGGEQRVLSIVGALVSGLAVSDLAGVLAGLDRPNLKLVLAEPLGLLGDATVQLPDSQMTGLVPGAVIRVEGVTTARLAGGDYGAIRATITGERLTPIGQWADWIAQARPTVKATDSRAA